MDNLLERLRGGLVVSCYAGEDINAEMAHPLVMAHMAKSVLAGGAAAVRTNLENVAAVKEMVDAPVIGIKKIPRGKDFSAGDFRITPTLREVELLLGAGADAVAIDGTRRERYDELSLEQFIAEIKRRWGVFVIADVSTAQEGVAAWQAGADMVGTTLSGYTPYSANPIRFGQIPTPEPDYAIIRELRAAGVEHIVAEGRYADGTQLRQALAAGAHCVVIGSAITYPKKIVQSILEQSRSNKDK